MITFLKRLWRMAWFIPCLAAFVALWLCLLMSTGYRTANRLCDAIISANDKGEL